MDEDDKDGLRLANIMFVLVIAVILFGYALFAFSDTGCDANEIHSEYNNWFESTR